MQAQVSMIDTRRFRAGEIILYPAPSTAQDRLYRVRTGLARIQSVDDEGNALTLRLVRPGEYFGEEALADLPREHFVEAATEVRVEELNPALLSPEETVEITVHLVAALNQAYQAVQRLVSQRLKNRIAAALLEFAATPVAAQVDGQIIVRVTHDEIAAAVGSVRETVTKIVGELSREGVIQSGYGKVVLLNKDALRSLSEQAV